MYIGRVVEEARENGYVQTLLGRKRYVPNINSRNRNQRMFAERVAVNMPIQGTQADMIKIAMINILNAIRDQGMLSLMVLQVHDELVFEVPKMEMEAMRTLIRDKMINALPLSIPLEVEINEGPNWLDAH